MSKRLLTMLMPLLAVVVMAGFSAASASATDQWETYCNQELAKGGTCDGSWRHIIINVGHDYNAGWHVCIDEYLDPSGTGYYTNQNCGSEGVTDYDLEAWGYPRVWNESGTQWIKGEQAYP
jgi:hypothetical protein